MNPGKIIDNDNIKVHTAEIEQDLGGKITLVTNIHVHIATETTVEPYPGEGSINSESRRSGHTQEEIQETARMAQMQEEIQETTRMAQMQEEITQYDPGGRAVEEQKRSQMKSPSLKSKEKRSHTQLLPNAIERKNYHRYKRVEKV